MEWIWAFILLSLMAVVWHLMRGDNSGSRLPPGPKGWPVVGNLFDFIGTLPHRSFAALKQQYGPVVWLKIGSVKTMVLLSAAAAEELYKNHDLTFLERPVIETMKSHDYYKSSMAFGPYGVYWRTLRRLCFTELFTNKKMNETVSIRQKCVDDMLLWIEQDLKTCATSSTSGIEVTRFVFPTLFNVFGNMMISRDLVDPNSTMASEFYKALVGVTVCMGSPNLSDIFSWLKWIDLQGLRRRMDQDFGKVIEIVSQFLHERVAQRQQTQTEGTSSDSTKDFLNMLLDFKGTRKDEPAKLSDHQVSVFLMEMFSGGTETMSTTIEWAMCELLQNSEAMIKIKSELGSVVGTNKKLEEKHIDNLHYLQAVVQETLRLHPPGPIIPRKAIHHTNFMGYEIPKDTQVFVHSWAIGRDEEFWGNDVLVFKPERFLGSNIEYKGQHFEFIPFGAGRRICPGLGLAHRLLPLVLGSLLHHFDWVLCQNVHGETTVDMSETMGITAKMRHHLKAVPRRSI